MLGLAALAGLGLASSAQAQVDLTGTEQRVQIMRHGQLMVPTFPAPPSPFVPRLDPDLYSRIVLGGFTVGNTTGGNPAGSGTQADVLFDDVNIPATRLQNGTPAITTQMIAVSQVSFGVHIRAGAPAGTMTLWWTPLDIDPATAGTAEIDTPAFVVGTVPTLANAATGSIFTVLTVGDGVTAIPGMEHVPLNMGFAYNDAGGGSFAIGVQDGVPPNNVMLGARAATGPDPSFNYYWRWDTDFVPAERGPFGLAAPNNGSFYVVVKGVPVPAVDPVGCCVPGTSAAVCFVADGAVNCAKSGGTALSLTGVGACSTNPCNTVVCCNVTTGVCTVIAGSPTCPGAQVAQAAATSCTGITCAQLPAPANDECAAAIAGSNFELSIPAQQERTGQVLVSATRSFGTGVAPACTFADTDVWYLLTLTAAQSTQQIQITAASEPTSGDYTAQPLSVAVYDATLGCPATPGSEVVCSDFQDPRVTNFTGTGSLSYYIRVAYFTPATTKFSIRADVVQTVACCSPVTGLCVLSSPLGVCNTVPGYTVVAPGGATTCTTNPCPTGACCGINGACTITGSGGCANYQGDGSTCSTTAPPCSGSCCNAATLACTATDAAGCGSGNTFHGIGSTCTSVPCPAPTNDLCGSAIALTVDIIRTGTVNSATGTDLTTCSGTDADVWYTVTPSVTGNYKITTSPASSADIGTAVALFSGACDPATDSDLYCSGSPGASVNNEILVSMTAGTTYRVRVATFLGNNANFSVIVATLPDAGACCNIDASCTVVLAAADCPAPGSFGGVNSSCAAASVQCPPGACCFPFSGTCNVSSQSFCTSVGGTWNGADTTCATPACITGTPLNDDCLGALTITAPTYTSNVGTEGASNEGTNGTCNAAGTTGANNSIWYKFTAPAAGVLNVQDQNYGTYTVTGADPDELLVVYTGTCAGLTQIGCFTDAPFNVDVNITAGTTVFVMLGQYGTISGGGWNTLTTSWAVNGTCCVGTFCTISIQTDCTGLWTTGGTCTPNPCTPAGVCCRGSTCSTNYTSAAACQAATTSATSTGPGFAFVATATNCNTPVTVPGTLGNVRTPCCYANYNHNAGIEVQDIFDYLNDWFAGRKIALVGGDGDTGSLTVQNIFDFLNSWFAGGCS
jgi:hypothetical protein